MANIRPKLHLPYIDCVRGYAVLLVITCHLTYEFPELPYPVHRLTSTGWFGVQLFFLASCLTLLLSWHSETTRRNSVDIVAFFTRRFFRIAPAYYAAGILYFFLLPPPRGFEARQMITSMMFINAWHPAWTPTVADAWTVVPGGWSIGVEFSFYLIFPFFAAGVTSLSRAVLVFGASVVAGVLLNMAAMAVLSGSYSQTEIENFLFFWFPNQMSVFALGGILFFLLDKIRSNDTLQYRIEQNGTWLAATAILAFGALAYVPLGHYLGGTPPVPASLAVSAVMMAFIIGLSANRGPLINRYAAAMGQVSFSAYLLHFAILRLFRLFPDFLHVNATGVAAIVAYAVGWVVAVGLTYGGSWVSYQLIEQPMVNAGKALMRARRSRRVDAPT